MINRLYLFLISFIYSLPILAAQYTYCPQHQGYIKLGMTEDQVIRACGQPLSKRASTSPLMKKVPSQQLFYNNKSGQYAFYGVWSIPVGVTGGAQLEIDVVNNKVSGISVNGSNTNASSVCKGANIQNGTPISQVLSACGNPSNINNTFILQPVPSQKAPEIWIYQNAASQPAISLTFVDGTLQSID